MPPRHDLLFWDLGNVLIQVDPLRACRRATGRDEAAARQLMARLIHSREQQALEAGELPPEAFHQRLVDLGLIDLDFAAFHAAWVDMFTPITESLALLEAVHRQRPCWLLSNTDALHFAFIDEQWGIRRWLAGTILSYEVRARKPQRQIFEIALARAGVAPERAGFIDDVAEHVAAARALAIDAVQFTGAEALREWLRDAGYQVPDELDQKAGE